MFLDNSVLMAPDLKNPLLESVPASCRVTSGEPSRSPIATPSIPNPPCPSMPAFVPRPFPPPALADVPVEYIVDQLRNLAPHYWNKPETADCTISS